MAADTLTPPRLVSPWFGDNPQFTRLAQVLEFTARRHCPGWSVEVYRIEPVPRRSPLGVASHAFNTMKMDAWRDAIAASQDGDQVLLIDADTMILRPLDDVWEWPFDIAYTVKQAQIFPFNSGVVFVRVTPAARAFVDAWQVENARLLDAPAEHQRWRSRYGGCNQAALGAMLESGMIDRLGLQMLKIPCAEWNCEDSSWTRFDPERTRIVHIKSALRRAVFGIGPNTSRLRPLVGIWRQLEREVLGPEAPPEPPPPAPPSLAARGRAAAAMRYRARMAARLVRTVGGEA